MRANSLPRLGTSALVLAVALVPALAVPTAAQAVPGLVIKYASASTSGSVATLVAEVSCPRGTVVIGGGGSVHGVGAGSKTAQNELVITAMRPSADGTSYYVVAREDETGFDGDWYVLAQATCAPPPRGYQVRWAPEGPSSEAARVAVVWCPDGMKTLGTGASISQGGPHVALQGVFPTGPDLTGVAALAHEDETGYGASWTLVAWAFCAYPQPGQQRVMGNTSSASVNCPAGQQVHGAGALPTGQSAHMRLNRMSFGVFNVVAELFEDETGYPGPGSGPPVAIPIAICAN